MAPRGYKNITIPISLYDRIAKIDFNQSVPAILEKVILFWENKAKKGVMTREKAIAYIYEEFIKQEKEEDVWNFVEGVIKRYRNKPYPISEIKDARYLGQLILKGKCPTEAEISEICHAEDSSEEQLHKICQQITGASKIEYH